MGDKERTIIESPHTRTILDSISEGVFTVDMDWRITSFNRAAEDITGISQSEALGQRCWEVLKASVCESDCPLMRTRESGDPVVNEAVYILNTTGERVPVSISTALLRDCNGNIIGGVETFRDLSMVQALRDELEAHHEFCDMVSKNRRMQRIFENLPQLADSESTVLIQGESGTGKEMVARALHRLSPRSDGPMVTVNCGALPDNLLESELFGHKAGAFTDAREDREGRFRQAEGGTIFLDEVGEMSSRLQVSLLRVLEQGTYQRLGSNRTQSADVRVLTATNQDLEEMVEESTFRRDLYYRIKVLSVRLPPLRERREDIPVLVDHFIRHFRRVKNKDIHGMSPEALDLLMHHDFPGNVRELENIVEHAFVLCSDDRIQARHLPPEFTRQPDGGEWSPDRGLTLEAVERRHIQQTLRRHEGSRQAAADELGVHRTTLYRKMKKYGLLDDDGPG
ncbi:MAG: sigma-54 interaction domain-containing protein [Planctomycetota bacterium]